MVTIQSCFHKTVCLALYKFAYFKLVRCSLHDAEIGYKHFSSKSRKKSSLWRIVYVDHVLHVYDLSLFTCMSIVYLSWYFSIIGLYVTFILLIGRMLRLSTTGMSSTISFRELPNVDHIIRLCLDLYLVREMREFRLEEDLYAKLIFVYRSAETRVKWTRLRMKDIEETKKKL